MTTSLMLFFTKVASAAGDQVVLPDPLHGQDLSTLVKNIFHFAAVDVGIVVVPILVIIGAYQMVFSGGESEKFTKGKNTIVYTIIGYAILLMAYGIVAIVKSALSVN